MTIREAIVTAAQTRVRPILMTATATIGAMVIPMVYELLHFRKSKLQRKAQ